MGTLKINAPNRIIKHISFFFNFLIKHSSTVSSVILHTLMERHYNAWYICTTVYIFTTLSDSFTLLLVRKQHEKNAVAINKSLTNKMITKLLLKLNWLLLLLWLDGFFTINYVLSQRSRLIYQECLTGLGLRTTRKFKLLHLSYKLVSVYNSIFTYTYH